MIISERKAQVTSSSDVVAYFKKNVLKKLQEEDQHKEHFWVAIVNGRNVIQRVHTVAMGCMTSAIVHPREVFRTAVMDSACALICVHNHPSNDPTPSSEDQRLTDRLSEAGNIIGIKLLDHIIVTLEKGYVSMMEVR